MVQVKGGSTKMTKLTGKSIEERYASGKRNNSFYEEEKLDKKEGEIYITEGPEVLYYIDKTSGHLKGQETTLLW